MLELKLQYFGHLMQGANSLEKDPDAGKDWGQEKKGVTEDEKAEWHKTSLVTQMVKCLPTMGETQVQSLGGEDPLEKEMAPHSSTLAWKIPWTRNLVGYRLWGRKESDTTEWLHFTDLMDMSLSRLWKMAKDREPWSAVVPGAAKTWTWLRDWTTTTVGPGSTVACVVCGEPLGLSRWGEQWELSMAARLSWKVWTSAQQVMGGQQMGVHSESWGI